MSNLREVKNDLLKDWLAFREEDLCTLSCPEDKRHIICFDEISEKILRNVPEQNRNFVMKQLERLDDNYLDYIGYWNEKYYRNGFCDGIELISSSFNN